MRALHLGLTDAPSLPLPALAKPRWSANGWLVASELAAWLSLDEGDNDPIRFLTYLVAALETIAARQSPAGNFLEPG